MNIEDHTEQQRWEEEAGWLCADPAYVLWLKSFGTWHEQMNNDERWIKQWE